MKYNDLIPELVVSNINISRDFYVNMLGFKVEYEREENKFIFLSLGNIQLMLEEGSEEELILHLVLVILMNFIQNLKQKRIY